MEENTLHGIETFQFGVRQSTFLQEYGRILELSLSAKEVLLKFPEIGHQARCLRALGTEPWPEPKVRQA